MLDGSSTKRTSIPFSAIARRVFSRRSAYSCKLKGRCDAGNSTSGAVPNLAAQRVSPAWARVVHISSRTEMLRNLGRPRFAIKTVDKGLIDVMMCTSGFISRQSELLKGRHHETKLSEGNGGARRHRRLARRSRCPEHAGTRARAGLHPRRLRQ